MLLVGPNPYGLTYTLGIQGSADSPKDALWYFGLAEMMSAGSIEFHYHHLAALSPAQLDELCQRLAGSEMQAVISGPWPLERLSDGFDVAKKLGVRTVRTHLSPILCGDRAEEGDGWAEIVARIRSQMPEIGRQFADSGITLAIENHQDFGSWELLEFAEMGGPSVGICLDTGNPLAVAEDPIAFTKRVAAKVRHVHLKDYRAQLTSEGYRLVRCPIGDGAVPIEEIVRIVGQHHHEFTATLEQGAHTARHIRLNTENWWRGYLHNGRNEVEGCFATVQKNLLPAEADWRTPVEQGKPTDEICRYEMTQMNKSIENMRALRWLPS